MKRIFTILIAVLVLAGLAGITAYFLTDPATKIDARRADAFFKAAGPGASLADATRASPEFKTINFGPCGHLDSSPDSGPRGSLIYSPAIGAFARYSDLDEFLKSNPKLLSQHDDCRQVEVVYSSIFPERATISLSVNGVGKIIATQPPAYAN